MADNVEVTNTQESASTDETLALAEEEDQVESLEKAFGEGTEEAAGSAPAAEVEPDDGASELPTDTKGIKVRLKAFETRGFKRGREAAAQEWAQEKAAYDAKLQKLAEYELKEDAAKLAKDEGISESIALRLLRAERGIAAPASTQPEQARDEKGRFVSQPKNDNNARVQELLTEAQVLEGAIDGLNVSALLESATSDEKAKLMSGELSLSQLVHNAMSGGRRTTPSVVRSPNAASTPGVSIANMSKDQFARLDEALSQGKAFKI